MKKRLFISILFLFSQIIFSQNTVIKENPSQNKFTIYLPEYQQENLVELIKHRLNERRRFMLANHIKEAREEYKKGEVKKGNIKDLMEELSE